jgi:hypothetical protein
MSESKWRYGDSWERYPIDKGEVWTHAESGSKVAVHDIRDPLPAFMRGVDLVYVDPPWSQGNANSFVTKAGLSSYVDGFEGFLDTLFARIAEIGPGVCYVEMGAQHAWDALARIGERFPARQMWPITYYRKHPCYLIRGGSHPTGIDFTGLDDERTPTAAILADTPRSVADLCTGRGLTLLAAHAAGCRFAGTDLNRRRLAVAIDRAAKQGVTYAPDPAQ